MKGITVKLLRAVLLIAVLLAGLGMTASAASAATPPAASLSVPASFCAGKSANTIVRVYTRGATPIPLRCGTSAWGFNHITARWNGAFDAQIALTLARGENARGSSVYTLFDTECNPLFVVVANLGALNGTGVRPQGVITAYQVTTSLAVPAAAVSGPAAVTGPGQDCPIPEPI
jgi:hypothetical protein